VIGLPKFRNMWVAHPDGYDGRNLCFIELLAPSTQEECRWCHHTEGKPQRYAIVLHENGGGLLWETEY
jgi:hypothetical protein